MRMRRFLSGAAGMFLAAAALSATVGCGGGAGAMGGAGSGTMGGPSAPRSSGGVLGIFSGSDTSGGAKDGKLTILLAVCRAPRGHVQQAKQCKRDMEKLGFKHVYIVHRDDHSLLYWGKYKTHEDAQPNLKKAKGFTLDKMHIFAKAIIVPVPGENVEEPQWRLDKLPPEYVYTVLRAIFYGTPWSTAGSSASRAWGPTTTTRRRSRW